MPCKVKSDLRRSPAEEIKYGSNNNSSEDGKGGDGTILTIEERHSAFENSSGYFLHGRRTGILTENKVCEIGGKQDCKKSYHNWNPDIVTHDWKYPPLRKMILVVNADHLTTS